MHQLEMLLKLKVKEEQLQNVFHYIHQMKVKELLELTDLEEIIPELQLEIQYQLEKLKQLQLKKL